MASHVEHADRHFQGLSTWGAPVPECETVVVETQQGGLSMWCGVDLGNPLRSGKTESCLIGYSQNPA